MDSTVLSLAIALVIIVIIPIGWRVYIWTLGDPIPIAQNKRLIIGLIGIFVIPVIAIICFMAAVLLKTIYPYLLAAGAAVIIVLILRKVKKNVDDRFNPKESYSPPKKPQTLKKAAGAATAKKYKMKY